MILISIMRQYYKFRDLIKLGLGPILGKNFISFLFRF